VAADPPDWLFVQFNQFSYGRYGFNPWLPLTLRRIRRAVPSVKIAWMAHEDFVPAINWKFAVMTLWQRWQFRALGRVADRIFFSIDPWVHQYRSWFDAPVTHLPVGSNIPRLDTAQHEARNEIGLPLDAFVVGIFGTMRSSRLISHIGAAVRKLHERDPRTVVLYVGPDQGKLAQRVPGVPVYDAGPLPAAAVSVHLSAMDLHLAPFIDGLSTRRGSAMASLQHGVATVSTDGDLTDQMLRDVKDDAVLLPPVDDVEAFVRSALTLQRDPALRNRVAEAGRAVYDTHFSRDVLTSQLLDDLGVATDASTSTVSAF
jgi:glycosyltransferase involved in cell wall biosynthesis